MNDFEKTCIDCKKSLPMSEFYTTKQKKKTYYSSRCKKCEILNYRTRSNKSYKKKASVLFRGVKSRCKKYGTVLDITKEDIIHQYELQNGICYYSGQKMSWVSNDDTVMSIDRHDNSLGYIKNNIVLCTWRTNKMKNDMPENGFLNKCKQIYDFSTHRKF